MRYTITITFDKDVTEETVNKRCEIYGIKPIEYHKGLNRHRIVCMNKTMAFGFAQSFQNEFTGKLIIEKKV